MRILILIFASALLVAACSAECEVIPGSGDQPTVYGDCTVHSSIDVIWGE